MNLKPVILATMIALIAFIAFALRDLVEATIILPLAYLWWLVKLYYAALPEAVYWALLAAFVLYSGVANLVPKMNPRGREQSPSRPAQGQIAGLADLIRKSGKGAYYKWLIANRLGKAAREILAQREGNPVSKKFGTLEGRGWRPSDEVGKYLNIGLNGSFGSVPRARWFWQSPPPTPLDLDPNEVADYLEDEMEMTDGRHQKSI